MIYSLIRPPPARGRQNQKWLKSRQNALIVLVIYRSLTIVNLMYKIVINANYKLDAVFMLCRLFVDIHSNLGEY